MQRNVNDALVLENKCYMFLIHVPIKTIKQSTIYYKPTNYKGIQ